MNEWNPISVPITSGMTLVKLCLMCKGPVPSELLIGLRSTQKEWVSQPERLRKRVGMEELREVQKENATLKK